MSARRVKGQSFLIDGETIILRDDGTPDFHAMGSRSRGHEALLFAFDLIEIDRRRPARPAAVRAASPSSPSCSRGDELFIYEVARRCILRQSILKVSPRARGNDSRLRAWSHHR
jgi:hypothetical protein